MNKPVAWVLAGPTASGKTALSLRLATEFGCEILCMDSMQIYRGMDIGTAKPTAAEMQGIPHHLLDIADPGESFSVAQYREAAERTAIEIISRGKRPLFVGGTGFYLRALRGGMALGAAPADPAFRAQKEPLALTPEGRRALHAELEAIDPVTAARLHENDARRVIRALEVFHATGLRFSEQDSVQTAPPALRLRIVCLEPERSRLYARIDRRVDQMLEAGLAEEVRRLNAAGIPEASQAMKAIGYKELQPFLRGECTLEAAADEIRKATRHYAKRQVTWMKKEPDVLHIDPDAPDAAARVIAYFTERTDPNDHD